MSPTAFASRHLRGPSPAELVAQRVSLGPWATEKVAPSEKHLDKIPSFKGVNQQVPSMFDARLENSPRNEEPSPNVTQPVEER